MKKIFKIFIKKNKKLVVISSIVLVISLFLVFNRKNDVYASDDIKLEDNNEIVNIVNEKKEEKEDKIETVKVDIKGEIINPGVYELELGKRIIDVVDLSGGFTNKAITDSVNLSKKIYDEMVIIIPDKGNMCEVIPDFNNNEETINIDNGLVNINTASLDELLNLTGVGESKAKAIIEYRKQNRFETIEDIMNIAGIKQSLFDKIKDEITV